jgi:hypothetical protein
MVAVLPAGAVFLAGALFFFAVAARFVLVGVFMAPESKRQGVDQ